MILLVGGGGGITQYFVPLCLEYEDTDNWFRLNIINEVY